MNENAIFMNAHLKNFLQSCVRPCGRLV